MEGVVSLSLQEVMGSFIFHLDYTSDNKMPCARLSHVIPYINIFLLTYNISRIAF